MPRSTDTARIADDHVRLDDADDAGGGADRVEAERARDVRRRSPPVARSGRSARRPPRKAPGSSAAEHDVGIGHGRLGAAGVVARRAGSRTRAARPDAQCAAGVDPRDAAAAGADRGDLDAGHADRLVLDADRARHDRPAVLDQADVEARAAHVDRDQVARRPSRRAWCSAAAGAAAGPDASTVTGARSDLGDRASSRR